MPSKEYNPSAWATRDYEFQLPSGDTILLRKLDPLVVAELGLQDKLDFATTVVMDKHVKNAQMSNVERIKRERARREAKAKGEDPDAAEEAVLQDSLQSEFMMDPSKIKDFREVLDAVVVMACAAPTVEHPPAKDADRIRGHFYTDSIPYNDKVAVFNQVMKGVRAVEQFREEPEAAVGDVAPKPSVRKPAQRRTGNSRKRSAS